MILKIGAGIAFSLLFSGLALALDHAEKEIVKLEPQIRVEKSGLSRTIPIERIRPFLRSSLILDCKEEFSRAPYIVAEEESAVVGGAGIVIYAKGIQGPEEVKYTIYQGGKEYKHPKTGEVLGFEANAIGTANLTVAGEPSTLKVETATNGIEVGNRLLPSFTAMLPDTLTIRPVQELAEDGYIMSARDGGDQIGRNSIVFISLGERDGIMEGNLLDVYQTGRVVRDPYAKGWRKKMIQLPDTRVGQLLIFQTYDKMSLGLVLEATEIIHLLDKVKCP